jgi:hypothetical protein
VGVSWLATLTLKACGIEKRHEKEVIEIVRALGFF